MRRLGLIIVVDRGWRAAFEGGDAGGAQGFERHEPDGAFAAFAIHQGASALHMLEECALSWAVEVPEAEIMLVNYSHLDRLPFGGDVKRHGKGGGPSTPPRNNNCDRAHEQLANRYWPLASHIHAILTPEAQLRPKSNTRRNLHYDFARRTTGHHAWRGL